MNEKTHFFVLNAFRKYSWGVSRAEEAGAKETRSPEL